MVFMDSYQLWKHTDHLCKHIDANTCVHTYAHACMHTYPSNKGTGSLFILHTHAKRYTHINMHAYMCTCTCQTYTCICLYHIHHDPHLRTCMTYMRLKNNLEDTLKTLLMHAHTNTCMHACWIPKNFQHVLSLRHTNNSSFNIITTCSSLNKR